MFGSQAFGAQLFGGTDCCCNVVPPIPTPSGDGSFDAGKRMRLHDEKRRREDDEDVALALSLLV